ncbi:hypothetical protein DC31_09975 [Microbacterium sp. CH12i]|uniref:hypothetical protein n=1 Tax=Microbacterium sp. CH12i TaxID=1479651 RepID=UPI0004611D8C|nr:hypothetical protein [Microbacterium sp. CH12i]KDA06388.1 hypothetical protein DC31_09975 [Microbacterium sp. CH12i]
MDIINELPAPVIPASLRRVSVAVFAGMVAVVTLLVWGTSPLTACGAVLMLVLALRLAHAGRTRELIALPHRARV